MSTRKVRNTLSNSTSVYVRCVYLILGLYNFYNQVISYFISDVRDAANVTYSYLSIITSYWYHAPFIKINTSFIYSKILLRRIWNVSVEITNSVRFATCIHGWRVTGILWTVATKFAWRFYRTCQLTARVWEGPMQVNRIDPISTIGLRKQWHSQCPVMFTQRTPRG